MPNNLLAVEDLTISQLDELALSLDEFLFKEVNLGEPYAHIYRKDRKGFKKLVRLTVKFRNKLIKFFKGQVQRAPYLYNLNNYQFEDIPGGINSYINDVMWNEEEKTLTATINLDIDNLFDLATELTASSFNTLPGLDSTHSPQAKFLRDYTVKLSGEIIDTTVDRIKQQIRTGIVAGETKFAIAERVNGVIDNPRRALMIAQTESIRAFSAGRIAVLKDLGFTKKRWVGPQAIDGGRCPNGEIVDIDEPFSNGEMHPPGHPNCKCGMEQADQLA